MKADVTRVMVEEHQLILRMIALVEQQALLLESGQPADGQFFLAAVDFIRNYADRYHHAKEEAVLFVELVKNGMPEKRSPIEAMLLEHDQGRAHVQAIEAAARKVLQGAAGQAPVLIEHARGYAALLRSHIAKEDTILYPLAERVLPEQVRERMLQAYAAAEGKTPGLAAKYRQMVAYYEQQLAD